jgi:hypothetical protein
MSRAVNALRHAMVRGERERCAYIAVALITEFGLILSQQTARQPAVFLRERWHGEELRLGTLRGLTLRTVRRLHQMDRVAILTGDAIQSMTGMIELRLLLTGLMASQTTLGIRFRVAIKRKDEFVRRRRFGIVPVRSLLRVSMGFARAVAHLAACDRIFLLRKGRMTCLAEFGELWLVTRFAPVAACIAGASDRDNRNRCHRSRFVRCRPRLRAQKSAT